MGAAETPDGQRHEWLERAGNSFTHLLLETLDIRNSVAPKSLFDMTFPLWVAVVHPEGTCSRPLRD